MRTCYTAYSYVSRMSEDNTRQYGFFPLGAWLVQHAYHPNPVYKKHNMTHQYNQTKKTTHKTVSYAIVIPGFDPSRKLNKPQ